MASSDFFEGTEKLLEVWFVGSSSCASLRNIDRKDLDELLALVKCHVLSDRHGDEMDAYVLSESSMFISKRRFILKTCGETTLLNAVEYLLKLAKRVGFSDVENVFYSRKNFMKPHLQAQPHHSFKSETKALDRLFGKGTAYALGRLNGDCWYLYTLDMDKQMDIGDQTLELLMTGLDENVAREFYKEKCSDGLQLTQSLGIHDHMPEAEIDVHVFHPCGYSLNGIDGNTYYTIHVTPQADCSYASFETNVSMESYDSLITGMLEIFNPNRLLTTLFVNKLSACSSHGKTFNKVPAGYKRTHSQVVELNCEYTLDMAVFVKSSS
jgi:S-adenosylmethionine decarboxylase